MKVLYICFTSFNSLNRGSSLRPYKIYNAFLNKGYQVYLISGNVKQRRMKFLEFKSKKCFNDIDYCYIEPSTYPCHPLDYLMLLYLKTKSKPIGLFYRDMYHKFPDLFKKTGIKKTELLLRYKIDWFIYKIISNTIFFPSYSMAKYFNFKNKAALPPGGEKMDVRRNRLYYNVIYVGGISRSFGSEILLAALKTVNETYRRINLILVCRECDKHLLKEYSNEEWLCVEHGSGKELKDLYSRSDFAIIPRERNEYNDFAVPVKLFEYISYGMPIVTTNCFETAQFVQENNIGIVVNDKAQDLSDAIIYLYNNPKKIYEYADQSKTILLRNNLWEHRIDRIEKHLLK